MAVLKLSQLAKILFGDIIIYIGSKWFRVIGPKKFHL